MQSRPTHIHKHVQLAIHKKDDTSTRNALNKMLNIQRGETSGPRYRQEESKAEVLTQTYQGSGSPSIPFLFPFIFQVEP